MVDPWNPSPEEIRAWAYDSDADEPCQDFDLALEWSRHEKALFECSSDVNCPKQAFFLRVLYLTVGDAVRTGYRNVPRPIIEGFVKHGDEYPNPSIKAWQQRSYDLMKHPDKFDHELWCAGGFVRGDQA